VGLACSVAGNALTIALKQADGVSDPSTGASAVKIAFRSTTTTAGSHTEVSATSATSITVSSGSTLGHTSAKTHYIWVYAINNSGTIELAVSSTLQDTNTVITTTAEGGTGTADSASVVYSTTSRTNVAARLIGRLQSNQTTAGTWAAVPTQISLDPSSITLSPNSFLPTGMVSPFAGTSAPNGWLLCDGSAVSRSTYAALFAVIGTTWGTGDGSTTFNVPNTSGIFIRGAGSQTISSITHTAAALGSTQNDQMQGHKHTVYWQDNNDYARTAGSQGVQQLSNNNIDTSSTSDVPVTDGTNGTPRTGSTTYPANITMNHIIKY
jgi:microcystin-dependent protein